MITRDNKENTSTRLSVSPRFINTSNIPLSEMATTNRSSNKVSYRQQQELVKRLMNEKMESKVVQTGEGAAIVAGTGGKEQKKRPSTAGFMKPTKSSKSKAKYY